MQRTDCLRILAGLHTDELVVCTLGRTSGQWWEAKAQASAGADDDTFYMRSSMGLVSSMALGLALALPHRRIWALDGDGSLALNLGSLLTLAAVAPPNLLHIVWFNGHYEITGNQPLGIAREASFEAIARGAGVTSTATVGDIDEFEKQLTSLSQSNQYSFIVAEVERSPRIMDKSPHFPADMSYLFAKHIERMEGKPILDYAESLDK